MAKEKKALILDDEEMILELVSDIFQLIGFKVTAVISANEAISKFKEAHEQGEPFDLVLFDMTLPGELDGSDVLREIRKLDPNIKAIVSSGYSQEELKAKAEDDGFDAAVPKPYSITVLKETVERLLGD